MTHIRTQVFKQSWTHTGKFPAAYTWQDWSGPITDPTPEACATQAVKFWDFVRQDVDAGLIIGFAL